MKKVKIKARANRYGKNFYDPDCELSHLLADIRKSKTLSSKNVKALLDIGYDIEYSGDKIDELDDLGAKYIEK